MEEKDMSILLGLLSLVISIAVPVLIMIFADFQLLHFSIFFIIPAGAIAIGYACGFGFFKGLIISNKKISSKHFIIGILMAFICLASIKYATYHLTCVSPETGKIEYKLDGNHISNYQIDGYGRMTFVNFNKFMIESTPITFSRRGSQTLGEVTNPTACWVFAIIDFLGVFIGVIAAGIGIKDKHQYCETCNKYKNSKKIFKLLKTDGQAFFDELEIITNDISESTSLKQIIEKYNGKVKTGDAFLECTLIYCHNCKKATLSFKLFEVTSTNKVKENSEFKYNVAINYNLVRDYIKEIAA
jgi:hypothetical protein